MVAGELARGRGIVLAGSANSLGSWAWLSAWCSVRVCPALSSGLAAGAHFAQLGLAFPFSSARRCLAGWGGGGKRKGRSKKWREILRFPHISQCDDLRKGLERDYDSLCDQQPIGRLLFRQFCERRLELLRCIRFQDAVVRHPLAASQALGTALSKAVEQKFHPANASLPSALCQSDGDRCRAAAKSVPTGLFCLPPDHPFVSSSNISAGCSSSCLWRGLSAWRVVRVRSPSTPAASRGRRGTFQPLCCSGPRARGKAQLARGPGAQRGGSARGRAQCSTENIPQEMLAGALWRVGLACAYETKDALCLVLTLMNGGDLKFHIYNMGNPGFQDERVTVYAAEICCGLQHLHREGIVSR
uniref:RGS domain-containing protein n=1 Tax=Pelodiscus sinensis TaxID=13735 RepID=K7G1B6_PELSI